jgi:hypothetical protein
MSVSTRNSDGLSVGLCCCHRLARQQNAIPLWTEGRRRCQLPLIQTQAHEMPVQYRLGWYLDVIHHFLCESVDNGQPPPPRSHVNVLP